MWLWVDSVLQHCLKCYMLKGWNDYIYFPHPDGHLGVGTRSHFSSVVAPVIWSIAGPFPPGCTTPFYPRVSEAAGYPPAPYPYLHLVSSLWALSLMPAFGSTHWPQFLSLLASALSSVQAIPLCPSLPSSEILLTSSSAIILFAKFMPF